MSFWVWSFLKSIQATFSVCGKSLRSFVHLLTLFSFSISFKKMDSIITYAFTKIIGNRREEKGMRCILFLFCERKGCTSSSATFSKRPDVPF
ncbi:Very-long-chain 3-oxoacyl-CoA reductase [Labeo rohita]|uniref:Very-long-chain 3-oxoacyl-CoA reductase n=1 Tax=Labeo rohita TaxID=84645 RepID=A0ABQ8MD87_LABRO|nr:Very-long-chain 3-oxoacyl-CoA reductase [Labeo rohita]